MRRTHTATLLLMLVAGCATTPQTPSRSEADPAPFSTARPGEAPSGWLPVRLMRLKKMTEYMLVDYAGTTVMKAIANASASGLRHAVTVDLKNHPWLQWRWKVPQLIENAVVSETQVDDSPARVIVTFEGGREQLHPQRVNLKEVLREAAALIEPVAAEKGLGFRVATPPDAMIETDPSKLRQILLNLLSNAVKFTESGEVTLEASADHRRTTFTVHDTGIGIPAEYMDKVFDAFWQVDQSSTRQVGGTGLGLSVARRLSRLLGGEISVQSEVGKGTSFMVVLPVRWGQPLSPLVSHSVQTAQGAIERK